MKFILICATTGHNLQNIDRMISSLIDQSYQNWNLFIVHQGIKNKNDLINLCDNKKIVYIHTEVLGLSRARNLALKEIYIHYSKDNSIILGFPDDDCYFYKETLQYIHKVMLREDILICKYGENTSIEWLSKREKNPNFIIFNTPSIGIYHKMNQILYFDERLGLGTQFPSSEDSDYVNNLIDKSEAYFTNSKLLYHKVYDSKSNFDKDKHLASIYGVGGYLSKLIIEKKEIKYILFLIYLIFRQVVGLIVGTFKGRKYHFYSMLGLIRGFRDFH